MISEIEYQKAELNTRARFNQNIELCRLKLIKVSNKTKKLLYNIKTLCTSKGVSCTLKVTCTQKKICVHQSIP